MKTVKIELVGDAMGVLSVRDIQVMGDEDCEWILHVFNVGCRKVWPHLYWRLA